MLFQEVARLGQKHRIDFLPQELFPPLLQLATFVTRQGLELEAEKCVDVERAVGILVVEALILALVQFSVDNTVLDEEATPQIVTVTGQQGVV